MKLNIGDTIKISSGETRTNCGLFEVVANQNESYMALEIVDREKTFNNITFYFLEKEGCIKITGLNYCPDIGQTKLIQQEYKGPDHPEFLELVSTPFFHFLELSEEGIAELKSKMGDYRNSGVIINSILQFAPTIPDACSEALDALWQGIILPTEPEIGGWDYPGQVVRFVMGKFKELQKQISK